MDEIEAYYNRSTPGMLLFGRRISTGAMHREVWGPGVATRREALLYVERCVSDEVQAVQSAPGARDGGAGLDLLDLGCGVGGTTLRIAEYFPQVRVTGLTLSARQAGMAVRRAERRSLDARCRFITGSFLELEDLLPARQRYSLAWAIESFIHAADPAAFFAGLAGRIEPGGRLVLVDDFLEPTAVPAAERTVWLERFRRGWKARSLLQPDQAVRLAGAAGFELVGGRDFSAWLRRSPDWLIRPVVALAERFAGLPGARNLLGDAALQICQARGWISYGCLVLRRKTNLQ